MTISIDPQAAAWVDDGTEAGHLRANPVRGNMAMVPLHWLQYFVDSIGSGSVATYQSTLLPGNPDGSGTGLTMTVPNLDTAGLRLWMPFYGRAFGIRWRRDPGTPPSVSVAVDGVPVEVNTGYPARLTEEGFPTAIVDNDARAITHDNLKASSDATSPDMHIAEIVLNRVLGVSSTLVLYGFLLDERAGYRPLDRLGMMYTTTTITTSAVEIPVNRTQGYLFRGIRKVIYTNTTGGAITVTVKNGSLVVWSKSIDAGDTVDFDPGIAISASQGYTHQASAGSSVNATVIGVS